LTTYILQYETCGQWYNYKDCDGFRVEFLDITAARSVARDLMQVVIYPEYEQQWRVVSSNGDIRTLAVDLEGTGRSLGRITP
jgi:hypothetical protein